MDAWLVGLSLACCRRWVLHACTAVVPFIPPCLCLCSSCAARLPIWAMAAGRAAALPEQMPQPQLWKPGGRAILTSPCPPARGTHHSSRRLPMGIGGGWRRWSDDSDGEIWVSFTLNKPNGPTSYQREDQHWHLRTRPRRVGTLSDPAAAMRGGARGRGGGQRAARGCCGQRGLESASGWARRCSRTPSSSRPGIAAARSSRPRPGI